MGLTLITRTVTLAMETLPVADSFRGFKFLLTKIQLKRILKIINLISLPKMMPIPPLKRMRTTTTMSSTTTKMTTTTTEMRGELAQILSTLTMVRSPNTSRQFPSGHLGPKMMAELIMSQISTVKDSLMTIIKMTNTLRDVPTEAPLLSLLTLQELEEAQPTRIPTKVPDTAQLLSAAPIRPPRATIQSINISEEAPTGIVAIVTEEEDPSRDSHICFLDINQTYSEQALSPLNAQCEFFFH
jgi:hypothetical protein